MQVIFKKQNKLTYKQSLKKQNNWKVKQNKIKQNT